MSPTTTLITFSLLAISLVSLAISTPAPAPLPKNVFRPEKVGFGYRDRALPPGAKNFPVGVPGKQSNEAANWGLFGGQSRGIPKPDKVDRVDRVDKVERVGAWDGRKAE